MGTEVIKVRLNYLRPHFRPHFRILPQIAMTGKHAGDAVIELDARGMRCPEPVLKLRAALREAPPGTRVRLRADDPLAGVDVKAYCLRSGDALVGEREAAGEWEFVVERR